MDIYLKRFLPLLMLLLSSCYKDNLYVQQEWVDKSYLASFYVKTPDPRDKNPQIGQKIIISWDFPLSEYKKDLTVVLFVRFWDQTQKELTYKIERKRGYTDFFFENINSEQNKKILTYRLDVVDKNNEIIRTWKHQLWTKQINIDNEENK